MFGKTIHIQSSPEPVPFRLYEENRRDQLNFPISEDLSLAFSILLSSESLFIYLFLFCTKNIFFPLELLLLRLKY